MEKGAKDWVASVQRDEDKLTKEMERTSKSKTGILVVAAVIITPLLSAVLSEVGKTIWTTLLSSLP